MLRKLLIAAASLVALGSVVGVVGAAAVDREDAVVVFPADVYVQGEDGQLRNPDDLTPADTPLFNVAGTGLDVSWGEWGGAGAVSLAKTKARTDIDLTFTGLIPGGVYSVFYRTFEPDSRNAYCPTGERGIALKARHPEKQLPDHSSFVADPQGLGEFRGRVEGALLDATRVDFLLIYHFDGQTYGELANYGEFVTQDEEVCRPSYGADAMRQLVVIQKQPG